MEKNHEILRTTKIHFSRYTETVPFFIKRETEFFPLNLSPPTHFFLKNKFIIKKIFPSDRERDVSRPFRGNPNSKQGVAHRICIAREKKKQSEALGRYVKESQLSKIHSEQDRRVQYQRSKNKILQKAGESALVREEEDSKQRLRERTYARQAELWLELA